MWKAFFHFSYLKNVHDATIPFNRHKIMEWC